MNITNKLFLERTREYFNKDSDLYLQLLNQKATSGFFINEKKAQKEEVFNLIDFEYSSCKFNPYAYYHNDENIGKTKAYELGLIYPQDVESSLPASFVNPRGVKLAIDLCAAPGGKSIDVLNKLDDDCLLISNDVSYKRASILASNLERLGLTNTMVTSIQPELFVKKFENCFDLVVLDAPCSGEGMIRKYPEILDTYSLSNIKNIACTQADLLETAYSLLKGKGQLLYSTCTYAFEEDENQIINFLSKHQDMKIVPIDIENNYSKLKGTIKLSPLNDCEGQFMCLMIKEGDSASRFKYKKTVKNNIVERFVKDNLAIENYFLYSKQEKYYLSFVEVPSIENQLLNYGIYLGELKKDRFEPSHSLYRSNQLIGKFKHVVDIDDNQYNDFVLGKELKVNVSDNYYLVTYHSHSLGYGKCAKGVLKNKYPKGLRRMV